MEINSSKNINSEVKKLEIFFNSYFKKNLVVDGYFGLEEKEAVIEFQENKNLDNDGIVGPKTLEVINAVYCVKNENKN
ncbi:MAG TPA: peptidoglycan-binding protein [Bacteroidia bacterium]|nr:peptidoglycan-binding protein [Bacteroidia bacterium]